MTMQCGLEPDEVKQIVKIIENHHVDLKAGEVDGQEVFNEVHINICDEEGMNPYIQVERML